MLLALDHIGVAMPSIEEYLRDFLLHVSQPIEVSPVFDDPHQGVSVCFVKYEGGCLELIQPLGHASPIDEILARGRGGSITSAGLRPFSPKPSRRSKTGAA